MSSFWFKCLLLLVLETNLCFTTLWKPCPIDCVQDYNLGEYNVSLLPLSNIWPAVYYHSDDTNSVQNIPTFFNISLCSNLTTPQGCHGDHVCYTADFNSFYSLAAHSTCRYKAENRILTLSYNYSSTSTSEFGSGNLTITLVCGPSIGVPEVIEGDPHTRGVEILWITSSICKTTSSNNKQNETRCYLVNHSHNNNGLQASFIDLSGLIQTSGYEATSSEKPGLVFNVSVCHPMRTGGPCDNAMICLYSNNSQLSLPNDVTLPLSIATFSQSEEATPHYEGNDVVVNYQITAPGISASCKSKAYAKIRFMCPTGDQDLGPTIEFVDTDLCQVNFLWVTTHACDVKSVVSSTCVLTTPFGIGFDFTDLTETTVTSSNSKYVYDLKPCSKTGLNVPCARTDVTDIIRATQTNSRSGICTVIGKGGGKLRYIDNGLSLTYSLGDSCHNGMARTTVITFLCPDDITTNCTGNCLSFVVEDHCIYEFEWITNTACSIVSGSKCKFQLNSVSYNFGLLTEDTTPTYAAISSAHDTVCYLISPCGDVEVTNNTYTSAQYCNKRVAPSVCASSSVCQIKTSGNPVPMGSFDLQNTATLTTIDHSVISVSTIAASSGKSVLIQYICQTGALLTTPVYISQYTDDIIEFHWYTSAACPQTYSVGSDCMVTEARTGFQFNLTSLSSQTLHFTDTNSKYHYMIQICSSLPSTMYPTGSSCGNNSAICQQSSSTNTSAGQRNSKLTYDNSMLKLTYTDGDQCTDHSHRKTTVVFLCDPNMHNPLVQNVTEVRHCDYLVEIKTVLACPPAYRSKECVYFSSDGNTYDLLELAKAEGNWQAEGSDGSVYLINVCRPLNLQGIGHCNPLSAVCRITSSTGHDLGYSSTSNLHHDNSSKADLVLTYTFTQTASGVQCPVVTTDIQFVCNRSSPVGNGPRHVSGGDTDNPCHFIFRWITRVVCPLINDTSRQCNVTDIARGYTFNLEPLKARQHIYTINDTKTNSQYLLTVCSAFQKEDTLCGKDGIAGCQIVGNNRSYSTGTYSSMTLTYKEKESITLTYTGGDSCSTGPPRRTEVDFVCERSAGLGYPRTVSEPHHCNYLFTWPTSLACLPTTLECVAGGGAYDLRPLMQTRNWRVVTSHGNVVLSVCQPVTDSSCNQSIGVGACTDSGTVLGYVTGDLMVVREGAIQLSYHNGAICSSDGFRKVTVINFHCNTKVGTGAPVLVSSIDGCRIEFNWDTVYACSQDSVSANWTISNPVTGQVYNLTHLKPVLSAISPDKNYNYTIGLGGHHVSCGGNTNNVSICQTSLKDGRSFIIARTTPISLLVTEGKVQVLYENGDNCSHINKRRKAVIYFEYDPRPDYLEVLPEEGCEYSLVVYTKLVHEEAYHIGIDCSLVNFPDLEWFTSQPTPPISIDSTTKLYFSVCLPISSNNQLAGTGYGSCSEIAGACIVNGSTVINLGRPSSYHPPQLATGGNGVLITYSGGDLCGNVPYTTKIMLTCSNTSSSDLPSLVYPTLDSVSVLSKSCEFVILWPSQHACPLAVPSTNVSATVCSIHDPYDDTTFNLNILSNRTHVMDTLNQYIIGLCGPIRDPPSGCNHDGVGICHFTGSQWMPMTNSDHQITIISHSPHTLDVVYPSGVTCTSGNNWLAIIRMYCSAHHSSNRPTFRSNSNCEMQFDWPTSSLCISESEACYATTSNGVYFDLERLVSKTWQGNYYHGSVLGVFNISICRNLNPTASEGLHCFPGPAGICLQADVTQSNSYVNLGHMTGSPNVTTDGVVLLYSQGDSCGSNNITTTVYLHCTPESTSSPVLIKIDSCNYKVDWDTEVACKEKVEESNSSCVLEDIQSGIQYNFNSLARPLNFSDESGSYTVCLCPGVKCSHPSIRNESSKTDLGKFKEMVVYPDGPQIIFQNGQSCSDNSNISSTIFMRCDRGVTDEKGRLVWEKDLSVLDCKKFFSWWTPLACPTSEVVCVAHKPGGKFYYDFNPLHPIDGYWTVTDSGTKYLINICGPIHSDEKTGCGGNAAICMRKSDGSYQDLAYVNTQSISFNSNGNPIIHFHGPKIPTLAQPFSVTIELICGLQSLHFRDCGQINSSFCFDWYTTFACPDTSNVHTQIDCSSYTEPSNAYTFNPSKISGDYTVSKGSYTFHINFCGRAQGCSSSSSVCRTEVGGKELNLGSSTSQQILIDSYRMQVNMVGSDGNTTVVVECVGGNDHIENYHLDEMIMDNSYTTPGGINTFFKLYTEKGCHFNQNGVPNVSPSQPGTAPTSASHSSNKGVVVSIVVLVLILCIVILLIVVILYKRDRRNYVIQKLFGAKSNEPVRYIRTKAMDTLLGSESSDESEEEEEIQETQLDGTAKEQDVPLLVTVSDKGKLSDEELLNL